ncbi:MAG: hypothetical protein AB1416_13455, partial [Actinomycetota bacterium]
MRLLPALATTACALATLAAGVLTHAGRGAPRPPATLAVAPGGSDAADCSPARPCATFRRAYLRARPGDVVRVAGGAYPPQQIPAVRGRGGPRVVFRPAPGARVRLGRGNATLNSLDVFASHVEVRSMALADGFYVHPGADDVTLRSLDVRFFAIVSASNVRVVGGDVGPVHDYSSSITPRSESDPMPRDILLDGVRFHDYTRSPGAHVECLQAWSIDGFVLRNSRFERCAVFGLFVANLFHGVTRDALIENNVFDEVIQGPNGGGQSVRIAARDTVFRYNSVLGTVFVDPEYSRGVSMVANVGALTGNLCQPGVRYDYNVWRAVRCGRTDWRAASGFVRPRVGAPDLHLRPGSAA